MTTAYDTTTAAQKLQELHAKIDAAMQVEDEPLYTAAALRNQALRFFHLQGGEAAELLNHLDALEAKELASLPSVELQDTMNWISAFFLAAINMRVDDHMLPVPAALWQSAASALECERYSVEMRVSQVTRLNALLMAPHAMWHIVQSLRTALVEADPDLASLTGEIVPVDPPLAVNHEIDALHLDVLPDGTLEISGLTGGVARFDPKDAYALYVFLRMPAVAAILEREHAARETASEIERQESMEEERTIEMSRKSALEWLKKDRWVRRRFTTQVLADIKRLAKES